MKPQDVYAALRAKGIDELHHANTVTTSHTFLELGGLASRGLVTGRGLPQTPQYTDELDQMYGIWDDVFTDTVDIHHRARRPNQYGPVLFIFDVEVLNRVPKGTTIYVTRMNPTKWEPADADEARFFTTPVALGAELQKGTFDQMVVFRLNGGLLPFELGLTDIVVDDPKCLLRSGVDAFHHAGKRLSAGTGVSISKRECRDGCKCVESYARFDSLEHQFG